MISNTLECPRRANHSPSLHKRFCMRRFVMMRTHAHKLTCVRPCVRAQTTRVCAECAYATDAHRRTDAHTDARARTCECHKRQKHSNMHHKHACPPARPPARLPPRPHAPCMFAFIYAPCCAARCIRQALTKHHTQHCTRLCNRYKQGVRASERRQYLGE